MLLSVIEFIPLYSQFCIVMKTRLCLWLNLTTYISEECSTDSFSIIVYKSNLVLLMLSSLNSYSAERYKEVSRSFTLYVTSFWAKAMPCENRLKSKMIIFICHSTVI